MHGTRRFLSLPLLFPVVLAMGCGGDPGAPSPAESALPVLIGSADENYDGAVRFTYFNLSGAQTGSRVLGARFTFHFERADGGAFLPEFDVVGRYTGAQPFHVWFKNPETVAEGFVRFEACGTSGGTSTPERLGTILASGAPGHWTSWVGEPPFIALGSPERLMEGKSYFATDPQGNKTYSTDDTFRRMSDGVVVAKRRVTTTIDIDRVDDDDRMDQLTFGQHPRAEHAPEAPR